MESRRQKKVLLMDDEEMLRKVAGTILRALGYECHTAQDGAEALRVYGDALAAGKPFDAVVLDLVVAGGMGGAECFARMKELDPETCAIVSSGYPDDPIITHYGNYGFAGAISKPYLPSELHGCIAEVIDRKSRARH